MTRDEIATELMRDCLADTRETHETIAAALRNGTSRDEILAMCDDVPETYAWLRSQLLTTGQYEAAVALMDDEIRERLHCKMALCSNEDFLDAYKEAHKAEFGEDFSYS